MTFESKIAFLAIVGLFVFAACFVGCTTRDSDCKCEHDCCKTQCEKSCKAACNQCNAGQEDKDHFESDGLSSAAPEGGKIIAINGELAIPVTTDPLTALKHCKSRMEQMQQSPSGSDENARALFAVMEAIDYLEGTSEVTSKIPDGDKNEPKE